MRASFLVAVPMACAAAAGCYLAGDGKNGDASDAGSADGYVDPSTTGLPCDVVAVLQGQCWSCHGPTPANGAPMSLVTYADLTAKSTADMTKTNAERCVARMQDASNPMPPGTSGGSAQDIATLQQWIAAGSPQGMCMGPPPPQIVCTSGQSNSRTSGGTAMHPGGMCNTCHTQKGEGPLFTIAGTVYPTAHEPDDCFGFAGAQVVIMDMGGNVQTTLTSNSRGNFWYQGAIQTPYKAKVVYGGKERAMNAAQTDGECNSCHTVDGANGAPGRIYLP